jgi:hypothetical protein
MLDLARRYVAMSALDVISLGLRTARLAAYSFADLLSASPPAKFRLFSQR